MSHPASLAVRFETSTFARTRARSQRVSRGGFTGVMVLFIIASTAITILWCHSMSAMGGMKMPGGWTMSMVWMRMPGQTWPAAAASFLGMWAVMMIAMMLPSLAPALDRYRRSIEPTSEIQRGRLSTLVGLGYFLVWTLFGLAVFPVGLALATIEMERSTLSRAVPFAGGLVVLLAGTLQFTRWKAHHLARCSGLAGRGQTLPTDPGTAWRLGLRLGLHCAFSCANLTAILLVVGVMDLRAMVAVTAAITAERLAPARQRVVQAIGAVAVTVGWILVIGAIALHEDRATISSANGSQWTKGSSMTTEYDFPPGPFEARYLAFLETVTQLRPALHRYCARMTGSVMDGEDVVQEALFEAYRKLDQFDDTRPLKPWLFRIAHNRCIDFLRSRGVRDEAETLAAVPEAVPPTETAFLGIGGAVEHLVLTLPPKERACVLLKDVFDYSLDEIAELVDSTVGGVKAALNRARTKLVGSSPQPKPSRTASPELRRVMELYVERFNRRDWDGVRELISADARLNVADKFAGRLAVAPYFSNWGRMSMPWRLAIGEVDGEAVVVILERGPDTWTPYSVVRLSVTGEQIQQIVDYVHCPWLLPDATAVTIAKDAL